MWCCFLVGTLSETFVVNVLSLLVVFGFVCREIFYRNIVVFV